MWMIVPLQVSSFVARIRSAETLKVTMNATVKRDMNRWAATKEAKRYVKVRFSIIDLQYSQITTYSEKID